MAAVKIVTYNCQGLNDNGKRIDVFQHLKEKKSDIYCLVDTHFTSKEENFISLQWGYNCIFNSKSSNSRGVAILFNNNIDYEIHQQLKDENGNLLMADISVHGKRFSLAAIYGPNNDSPLFFKSLFEEIDRLANESVIICGDFSLVLDPEMDYYNYKQINNKNARKFLLDEIEVRSLSDPFRALSPLAKRYTWRKKSPLQQSRLDFFLVSEDFRQYINKCEVGISYRSDHSVVLLEFNFYEIKVGKPLWKHNNSLLQDIEYVKTINDKIKEVKQQYALPVYNLNHLDNVPDEEIQFIIDDQLFLETLLMELRGKSISFSAFRKKQKDLEEKDLIQKIKLNEENLSESNQKELDTLKHELEKLRREKIKGYVIRSRAQWIEEGEKKPTNFFCKLEKNNYVNKTMYKLKNNDGNMLYDQFEILWETRSFYSNLYENKDAQQQNKDHDEYLHNCTVPKLSNAESLLLEGELTFEETTETLRNMVNNKSPGSDGFLAEFFKVFWQKLGHFVLRSINCGFRKGELSITQKEGIITCIPKEKKPREMLRNWRPITLLNVVYKIASGSIANRMKPYLPNLIHSDQTGFITGRFIGENTRMVYDLMQYADENNVPGLLLLIDFEKAFDSLSWSFMTKVLQMFNFGPSFINWVKVFHKNSKSAVSQSGHLSSFFQLGRGCRQGDPISLYLFVLCAEILAIKIRANQKIKGIMLGKKHLKIFQYADDTGMVLDGSNDSLHATLYELDNFAIASGLRINYEKTQVIWIGIKKFSQDTINTKHKLVWGKSSFKLLGIEFSVDLNEMLVVNYKARIIQLKKQIMTWKHRNLTPIGKITVIKTLLMPTFNHLFLSLPNPDHTTLKTIHDALQDFLWKGPPRIKEQVLIKSYSDGGLKMLDVYKFVNALKITWIRRLITSYDRSWQQFISKYVNFSELFCFGKVYVQSLLKTMKNQFWKDVLTAFYNFMDTVKIDTEF